MEPTIQELFNQAISSWISVVEIQNKIADVERSAKSPNSGFMGLKEHTVYSHKIDNLSKLKRQKIAQALQETTQYTQEKYGISIGKKYLFNVAGWDPFTMVVDMLKPAGTLNAPMIVCMGYLDNGTRKSVILFKDVKVTPVDSKVVSIENLLRIRSGKLPVTISVK